MLGRRGLLGLALIGTAAAAGRAEAQIQRVSPQALPATPSGGVAGGGLGSLGLDAAQFGLRAGSADDQSRRLQEALVEAAKRQAPLLLQPGRYRISRVVLPEGMRLVGVPGATVLAAAQPGPILVARRIRRAAIEGLVLDGLSLTASDRSGLLQAEDVAELSVEDCEFRNAGVSGVSLLRTGGRVERSKITGARDHGLFSLDSRGLMIDRNIVEDSGNNAIALWRTQPGDDNSRISGNRISRVRIEAGGDGQNGNGVVLFKAGGVIVEGNAFRDCALTFIRNNSSSAVQMLGNNGRRCGEVGYYSEFAFEGTVMANNIAEDVAQGFSITNLDHGGRLAICANNIVRRARRGLAPKGVVLVGGTGIHVEAEASVTGNVIEEASDAGISLGWSWAMRNLLATGNMVRACGIGIGVSLVPKERNVVVANNVIAGSRIGAVVGTEYGKTITGDLTQSADRRAAGIRIEGNAVA
jgi:uncharacterized secreted repeat protein (TIGR03808 family)